MIKKKDQCSPRGCRKQQEVKEQRQKEQRDQSRATRRWRWRWSRRRWRSSRSRRWWSRTWSRSTPRGTRVFPNARTHTCSKVGITGKRAKTQVKFIFAHHDSKVEKSIDVDIPVNELYDCCSGHHHMQQQWQDSFAFQEIFRTQDFLRHHSTNKYIHSLTFNFFRPPKNTPILLSIK